jgi:hypothetical protein
MYASGQCVLWKTPQCNSCQGKSAVTAKTSDTKVFACHCITSRPTTILSRCWAPRWHSNIKVGCDIWVYGFNGWCSSDWHLVHWCCLGQLTDFSLNMIMFCSCFLLCLFIWAILKLSCTFVLPLPPF